jgi:predicted transposase/invertase (TIGR01784 family)
MTVCDSELQFDFLSDRLVSIKQKLYGTASRRRQKDSRIVGQVQTQADLQNQVIIELVSTVMVYKFPELSWEAIEAMFGLSELKQTRVYQQALQEGRQEGRQEGEQAGEARIVLRLLSLRIGELSPETRSQVQSLSSQQLEALSEALLNFSQTSDLQDWLRSH